MPERVVNTIQPLRGAEIVPGPCPPEGCPEPVEIVCIQVDKIFDACSQKHCLEKIKFWFPFKCKSVRCRVVPNSFEARCRLEQIQDDPPLVEATVDFRFMLEVECDGVVRRRRVVASRVDPEHFPKKITLFGIADEMFCKVEAVLECLGCDVKVIHKRRRKRCRHHWDGECDGEWDGEWDHGWDGECDGEWDDDWDGDWDGEGNGSGENSDSDTNNDHNHDHDNHGPDRDNVWDVWDDEDDADHDRDRRRKRRRVFSIVKCDVGVFLEIKTAAHVQLLVPSYGFCPPGPDCEELPTRCEEFLQGPTPRRFPPQPWQVS